VIHDPAPRVLALGGLDPGGGAGLLADASAIKAAGGQPLTACAALTAQGDEGVDGIFPVPAEFLDLQLRHLTPVAAVKTGVLWSVEVIDWLAARVRGGALPPPVVDPVMRASSGGLLLEPDGVRALRRHLVRRARAVTPNLVEAGVLLRRRVESPDQMEDAARALVDAGAMLAVITGGHLTEELIDVGMSRNDGAPWRVRRQRVPGSARGTGCRFAAALATHLAQGLDDREAVTRAGELVADHVRNSGG
jgi:hydroxymethylpyrimidine/phosphomethylpyrimidine kinase